MCLESRDQSVVVRGTLRVKPNDNLFWFGRPHLLLHLMYFILFQNSFQLAFFAWTRYKYGLRFCFHKETEDIVLEIVVRLLVQFLCGYVTLPLYALVTQMGSSMKTVVFPEQVIVVLKNWHKIAKKNVVTSRQSSMHPSRDTSNHTSPYLSQEPSPSYTVNPCLSDEKDFEVVIDNPLPENTYLNVDEKVEEKAHDAKNNELVYNGEITFAWLKQERGNG